MISKEEKKQNFTQTIVFFRKENKNFLRSAAALENKSMYEFLDEILTEKRKEFLKSTINSQHNKTTKA